MGKYVVLTSIKIILGFLLVALALSDLNDNKSYEGLKRGKEHFDRLNMSGIYPLMEKQVMEELETNNLSQADPIATVQYLKGILLHALGIINVPKRYFKKKSVVLVKKIVMDLRTDMTKLDEEREDISKFYNDTEEEKERYYSILGECKSLFVLLDMKFNRVGNYSV